MEQRCSVGRKVLGLGLKLFVCGMSMAMMAFLCNPQMVQGQLLAVLVMTQVNCMLHSERVLSRTIAIDITAGMEKCVRYLNHRIGGPRCNDSYPAGWPGIDMRRMQGTGIELRSLVAATYLRLHNSNELGGMFVHACSCLFMFVVM